MTESGAELGAAIDIGSNSVHLLVAATVTRTAASGASAGSTDREADSAGEASGVSGPHLLRHVIDRSELLGLGDVVDEVGAISDDALRGLLDAVGGYCTLAAEAGADQVTVVGTEPLRRAANTAAVARRLLDETGVPLHVITDIQEAQLTFLGVTEGRVPAQPMMVVDIGGGSTEIGLYVPGPGFKVVALPIGSARLTVAHVRNDPPSTTELDTLYASVAKIRGDLPPPSLFEGQRDVLAVFVGGTATNVARLGRLARADLAKDRMLLAQLDSVAITDRFGVRPRRARQLAAGTAIVDVLLDHFGLDEAVSSEASLRDGAIIAAWRLGEEWPRRLGELLR